ncbi:MAG: hypothetical protein NZ585_14785 [Chloracidobacterium sp.]|nr:hypothetical protein [Chloracidobacterium sp.]MDW8217970.1 hypothetical protein [Acidobacteriota bacterium]
MLGIILDTSVDIMAIRSGDLSLLAQRRTARTPLNAVRRVGRYQANGQTQRPVCDIRPGRTPRGRPGASDAP